MLNYSDCVNSPFQAIVRIIFAATAAVDRDDVAGYM